MIPRPINTLVTMAGVEWNWINVYRMMPVEHKKQMGTFLKTTVTESESIIRFN
jgi:hypothetical protein